MLSPTSVAGASHPGEKVGGRLNSGVPHAHLGKLAKPPRLERGDIGGSIPSVGTQLR